MSAGPVIMHCTMLHVYRQYSIVCLLAEDLDLWQQQGAIRQLICTLRLCLIMHSAQPALCPSTPCTEEGLGF